MFPADKARQGFFLPFVDWLLPLERRTEAEQSPDPEHPVEK
jgi:hypothetical protein